LGHAHERATRRRGLRPQRPENLDHERPYADTIVIYAKLDDGSGEEMRNRKS